MSVHQLLKRLEELGVELTLAGEGIRYKSRGQQLPPELLTEMKQHRGELVSILTHRSQLAWPPPRRDAHDGIRTGPLTAAQRTVWATNFFLDDGTYNLAGAVRLRGVLDTTAFAAALGDVHHRHPSLRTVFPMEHGEPRQHILTTVPTRLEMHEVAAAPGAAALDDCLRECASRADEQLAVDDAPPVRTRLYRLSEEDHVFFVVLHHVIADGPSVPVLIDDLARCYNARLDGHAAAPPPSHVDMVDYAHWERDRLRYADFGADRRYWSNRLHAAALGPLPLPPPVSAVAKERRGGSITATIDSATTAAMRQMVAASRTSVFMVVSAGIATMLSRYTGRYDMVVGMPVACRDRDGLGTLVGLLLDVVPVRIELESTTAFTDLVTRMRTAILGAVSHSTAPTEITLGEELASSDASGGSVFNVVITDAGTPLPEAPFRGLEASHVDVPHVGAKYDLNFLIRDDGNTVNIDVEFDTRAISAEDVRGMASMVRTILSCGTANPERRAADLAAAPFAEIAAGAAGVEPSRVAGDNESLVSRLMEVARERGDVTAVVSDGREMSYRELSVLVGQIARGLHSVGVERGDVVAVSLPRGVELLAAMMGVMASGAAYLVIDDAWPPARVEEVIRDAGVRRVIADESDRNGERFTVTHLAEIGSAAPPCRPSPASATAYVIYTSGSTGHPKGVHVSHRNALSMLDATSARYGFDASDRWTLFHSCSFDFSVWEIFGCLLHGGRLVVVPSWVTREPESFAELVRRERITVLSQTPSAVSVMLPAMASTGAAETIRFVVLGGEALKPSLVAQWHRTVGDGAQLVNMYGITETTVHSSWSWVRPDAPHSESDIGRPLPGTSLHLLHDNGSPVLDRCVGEIYVGGGGVSLGYVGRPRETALRFVPDPHSAVPGARMYRSGDLGRRNGTSISYVGRRDSQVQVNGFRVELSEIEEALTAQKGVAAAVVSMTSEKGVSRLVAAVAPEAGAALSERGLVQELRRTLPRYMVPNVVRILDGLPMTANGKLDGAAVAALMAPRSTVRSTLAPRGRAEELLVELFREVLQDSASAASNFFELGGDSMRAIRLISLAREKGMRFTVRDVYANPTVSELAARAILGDSESADARPPFSLLNREATSTWPNDVEDAYPMTALQSGMIFHQELAPGSGMYHIVLSYRVADAMHPEEFRSAVQAVMDAHVVLRTSFDLGHPAGPMQRVHRAVDPPLELHDLRVLDWSDQQATIQQVVERERATPFELARAPLFRLVVLTLSDNDFQLVFAHHHAILDGWSVNVFFSELHAEYQRRVYGRDADALAAPRTRFVDYVALEQRAMSDPADAEFWADHTSVDPTLVAPERGGQPVMRQVRVDLPVGMIDELRKTAVEVGVPVKALLLAAHVRLVAWLTGRNEVVTGLSFSCRPEERDSDRMLGLFLNELPVRADVAGQTWAELARRLHAQELSMMPHRWYPYALMQKRYGHPLFDSNFNFTEFHTTRRLVRDGAVEVHDTLELESTHYVLGTNYTVDVWTGQLRLILEFDEAALDGATAFLAAEAHRRIVRAIVGDAGADCRNVPLPGAADVAKAVEWSRRTDASEVRTSALVSPEEAPTCAAKAPSEPSGRREADVLAPLSSLEDSVRRVWVEVLGPGDYESDRNFFDVGGSSLTAMQMVNRLRAKHGPFPLGRFMDAPTIADVARSLAALRFLGGANESTHVNRRSGVGNRYPLSRAQHQMWLLATRLPGLPLFGMPGAIQADGPLDVGVFRRTIDSLIRRHDALRSWIISSGNSAELVMEPRAELSVEFVDLSGRAGATAQCDHMMAAAAREPFDLGRAPLMSSTIFHLDVDRHVIFFNIHHVVCDGWSLNLLLEDAVRTYRTLVAGGDPDLAPPRMGSAELTVLRNEWSQSAEAADQRRYWVERLAPPWRSLSEEPTSRFTSPKSASLVDRFRTRTCRRKLDPPAIEAVRRASVAHGLTEFMMLLSAYATTLQRWSGQRDMRIATLVANRTQPGTEAVVGLLANTLVLRMDVDDPDPAVVARRVREVCLDAFDRQELAFEDVLAALQDRYSEETRQGPLFEAMLVMQDGTRDATADEGLRFSAYASEDGVLGTPVSPSTCDFILAATPARGELVLDLIYKPATTSNTVAAQILNDIAVTAVTMAHAMGVDR